MSGNPRACLAFNGVYYRKVSQTIHKITILMSVKEAFHLMNNYINQMLLLRSARLLQLFNKTIMTEKALES